MTEHRKDLLKKLEDHPQPRWDHPKTGLTVQSSCSNELAARIALEDKQFQCLDDLAVNRIADHARRMLGLFGGKSEDLSSLSQQDLADSRAIDTRYMHLHLEEGFGRM